MDNHFVGFPRRVFDPPRNDTITLDDDYRREEILQEVFDEDDYDDDYYDDEDEGQGFVMSM